MLREAVARAPNDTHALANLAGVLKELRRLDEAEVVYGARWRSGQTIRHSITI